MEAAVRVRQPPAKSSLEPPAAEEARREEWRPAATFVSDFWLPEW